MHPADKQLKLLVLGTAQDGGYPQAGCSEKCCAEAWNDGKLKRLISSLAILSGGDCWLIDITPDFSCQLRMIETVLNKKPNICGIFITHAHMGHYTGLLELGLEVLNTQKTPVYVMAKMKSFLEENAPFTQLVEQNNIQLQKLEEDASIQLNRNLSITPFLVPHRNEYSETVGFKICSQSKSIVYIPDIDTWDTWSQNINDLICKNDILLLDGTFFNNKELPGRNLQDVPHPFLNESLQKFSLLEEVDRDKVYFTHLNHSNPVIQISSLERSMVYEKGCHIAEDGMLFAL